MLGTQVPIVWAWLVKASGDPGEEFSKRDPDAHNLEMETSLRPLAPPQSKHILNTRWYSCCTSIVTEGKAVFDQQQHAVVRQRTSLSSKLIGPVHGVQAFHPAVQTKSG